MRGTFIDHLNVEEALTVRQDVQGHDPDRGRTGVEDGGEHG
jgi:hypothetical protein